MRISRNLLFAFLLLAGINSSLAQITAIPDANFEQALIDQGIDSDGVINGQVTTADIASITNLNVVAEQISSLTGIEDFSALTNLYAYENDITSVDFSQNVNLKIINLDDNMLSAIDVSMLPDLVALSIINNHILSLDLTNNPEMVNIYCSTNGMSNLTLPPLPNLSQLYCYQNNIDSLDLSSSPSIDKLFCEFNNLSYLNLKHGGSSYMEFFSATDNPDLTCILVENTTQAENCCSSEVPLGCVFSTDCVLNVENFDTNFIDYYPNPTHDELTVICQTQGMFKLYSIFGDLQFEGDLIQGQQFIDLTSVIAGTYVLKVKSVSGESSHIRIIKD